MDLCGHATLAAAHVIFNYYEPVKKFKHFLKVCIKSPCTVSMALLALIEVHGLLIQTLSYRDRRQDVAVEMERN